MRRLFTLSTVLVLSLIWTSAALADGPAIHLTEDVTGDTIVCGDTTYTIVSGEVKTTLHEGEAANGNFNFTGTITPQNVVAEDEEGNTYRVRGAVWFGATGNANTGGVQETFTGKIQIVGEGGTADSVNLVGHFSPNGKLHEFDFGTCEAP